MLICKVQVTKSWQSEGFAGYNGAFSVAKDGYIQIPEFGQGIC